MKEYNAFDHKAAEMLHGHEEVAPPHVGVNVLRFVAKKPSRKPFLWVFGAFSTALLIGGIAYARMTSVSSDAKGHETKLSPVIVVPIGELDRAIEPHTQAPTATIVHEDQAKPQSSVQSVKTQKNAIQPSLAGMQSAHIQLVKPNAVRAKGDKIDPLGEQSTVQDHELGRTTHGQASISDDLVFGAKEANQTTSKFIEEQQKGGQTTLTNGLGATDQSVYQKQSMVIAPLIGGSFGLVSSIMTSTKAYPLQQILPSTNGITLVKSRSKNNQVDVYSGARYSVSILKSKAIEHTDYLALRKATERSDLGWELGFRYSKEVKKGFFWQSGMQLAQNTAVFHYDDIVVRKGLASATTTDSITMSGVVRYEKIYNRSYSLDIPFALGAEVKKGRFGLRYSAGAELNLGVRNNSGMMFVDSEKRQSYSAQDAKQIYKTNVGARLVGQVQAYRSVFGRNRLFIESGITYQPWSSTVTENYLTQRYLIASMRMGYAFWF
jgi:hypothetical protein